MIDEFTFLQGKLLAVLHLPNPHCNPLRSTAQLDAAEILLATEVTPSQHAEVRAELLAGLAGERGYEPQHTVRAVSILLGNPAVTP